MAGRSAFCRIRLTLMGRRVEAQRVFPGLFQVLARSIEEDEPAALPGPMPAYLAVALQHIADGSPCSQYACPSA